MDIAQILSGIFLILGCVLGIIGAIGVLRFPDFYSRMHASGITDTACTGLSLIGLMFHFGWSLASAKLLVILLFMLFTCPTGSHALARTAQFNKLKPWALPQDRTPGAARDGRIAGQEAVGS